VNWASGYDAKGRPIEAPDARTDRPRETIPSPYGAHNWHPMSFNPGTGLAYFPAQNVPLNLMDDQRWTHNGNPSGAPHGGVGWNLGALANVEPPSSRPFGRLVAWDPVRQREAWRQEFVSPWNGGTLTTAGNLVFSGTADGRFIAWDATTGTRRWETPAGTGVVAAPSTYLVDGRQYVSIAVGWGGIYGLSTRATDLKTPGTVYTFALDGKASMPEFVRYATGSLVAGVEYDPADVQPGALLYVSNCIFCHGIPGVDRGGSISNLGYMDAAIIGNLNRFVFSGPATARGMPDFTGRLSATDIDKIKAFIQGTVDSIRPK
jgi:mono/diheme cytochrome c family protein